MKLFFILVTLIISRVTACGYMREVSRQEALEKLPPEDLFPHLVDTISRRQARVTHNPQQEKKFTITSADGQSYISQLITMNSTCDRWAAEQETGIMDWQSLLIGTLSTGAVIHCIDESHAGRAHRMAISDDGSRVLLLTDALLYTITLNDKGHGEHRKVRRLLSPGPHNVLSLWPTGDYCITNERGNNDIVISPTVWGEYDSWGTHIISVLGGRPIQHVCIGHDGQQYVVAQEGAWSIIQCGLAKDLVEKTFRYLYEPAATRVCRSWNPGKFLLFTQNTIQEIGVCFEDDDDM